ncbi:MAG: MFS transporter [Gemmatimonadales bacterium]
MRRALWLGLAQCVAWGTLFYGFGIVLPAMQRELGGSTVVLSGAFSLALAISGAVGLAVGHWMDRGRERVIFFGGIGLGVAALLSWASLHSIPALYLTMAAMGVAMALALYEPAFALVDRWYDTTTEKNRALTIVTLCGALASPIFVPLITWSIGWRGWRETLLGAAAVLGSMTLVYRLLLGGGSAVARHPHSKPPPFGPSLWWLGAGAFGSSFGTVVVATYLPTYLTTRGVGLDRAALIIAVMGLAQFPARAAVASLTERWGSARVFAMSLTFQALAIVSIPAAGAIALVAAAVFGAGNGAATILRAVAARDLTGGRGYGATVGRLGAFAITARALAPIGGASLALVGGRIPFVVTAAILVASAAGNALAVGAGRRTQGASSSAEEAEGPVGEGGSG